MPRAQVADGEPDDLCCPVWTQPRIVPQELALHIRSTEASVHQGTDIQTLIHGHCVAPGVPEAARGDICLVRTHSAPRDGLRSRPWEASLWRNGVRVRDGSQSCDRQDSGTNYRNPSRRPDSVGTTSPDRPDDASTHCHIHKPLARNDVVDFRPVILRPAQHSRCNPVVSLIFRNIRRTGLVVFTWRFPSYRRLAAVRRCRTARDLGPLPAELAI